MPEPLMTNKETAAHFRKWIQSEHGMFAWPTDACGYNQSVRFSQYRNENMEKMEKVGYITFCLEYADKIENEPDTLCKCIHPNVKVNYMCYCCDEPTCKFHGQSMNGDE